MWTPPGSDVLKINTDGSFIKATGKVCGGYIIRDMEGNLITGNTYSGMATSSLVAEALVLRDAIIFALNLSMGHIVVESDNLQLIQACHGELEMRCILNISQDINALRSNFEFCGLTWVARQGNICAHMVADLHRQSLLPTGWIFRPPSLLRAVLVKDKMRSLECQL